VPVGTQHPSQHQVERLPSRRWPAARQSKVATMDARLATDGWPWPAVVLASRRAFVPASPMAVVPALRPGSSMDWLSGALRRKYRHRGRPRRRRGQIHRLP